MSHLAVVLAAFAHGASELKGLSDSADVQGTINAVCQLGAIADLHPEPNGLSGTLISAIPATGDLATDSDFDEPLAANTLDSLIEPLDIECGSSAHTVRLLLGVLAGYAMAVRLFGDEALSRLSFGHLIRPLLAMGARINRGVLGCRTPCGKGADTLPLLQKGYFPLRSLDHHLTTSIPQLKDALLLAALRAEGLTSISETAPSPNQAELLLSRFGINLTREGQTVRVMGPQSLAPATVEVLGDPSKAALFAVAAALIPGSDITLCDVYLHPSRMGFARVMQRMGADIRIVPNNGIVPNNDSKLGSAKTCDDGDVHNPYTGSLRARYVSELTGTTISATESAELVDEISLLALLATQARGQTIFADSSFLRRPLNNTPETLCAGLQALGCDATLRDKALVIGRAGVKPSGTRARKQNKTAPAPVLESQGNAQLALVWTVAQRALCPGARLNDADVAQAAYPNFLADLESLSVSAATAASDRVTG
jgi:3-phosphoshikimate 1-carboxyvinyltransferase